VSVDQSKATVPPDKQDLWTLNTLVTVGKSKATTPPGEHDSWTLNFSGTCVFIVKRTQLLIAIIVRGD
jgi:hypothetical protein